MTTDPAHDGGGAPPSPSHVTAISSGVAAEMDIEAQFANTDVGTCACRYG